KLWLIIRALGRRKIESIIREHISFAQRLAQLIQSHPNFRLLAPVPFSTVVFQWAPAGKEKAIGEINVLNEKLLETINATGQVFLSHTKLHGRFGIRLAIGNIKTTWEDIATAWKIIQNKAEDLM
ncbi:MAG: pyridoxal-dependent decarboxylase, partial [candidate division KSB1 bacterium]|nr:pyridoxal-dependent decarboxylase [candidate division KSB1 bacterium]